MQSDKNSIAYREGERQRTSDNEISIKKKKRIKLETVFLKARPHVFLDFFLIRYIDFRLNSYTDEGKPKE